LGRQERGLTYCAVRCRCARDAGTPTRPRERLDLARTKAARATAVPLARARSGHHGEAARRRRAHLAVDARAGEGAHRGAARQAVALALARSLGLRKTKAPAEERE
jgi:hypothetical protein